MKWKCPNLSCSLPTVSYFESPETKHSIQRSGFYRRQSDSRFVQRFKCSRCGCRFSAATRSAALGQKKRRLNPRVALLLNSGVSQRRAARMLGVNRKTIVRKFRFMAEQARLENSCYVQAHFGAKRGALMSVQFDDLETSEHSKCKPLSVALAVEPSSRKILGFQVSQMPAKGPLAALARRKYGSRPDQRERGWNRLMRGISPLVNPRATITSDENPHYPRFVKRHFPEATHVTVKGRRGCVAGQGELKKIGFDPLFALNHTCAMLRANLNRLFRRTWCTTKTRRGLINHLNLYVAYHNRLLTPACPR